MTNSRTELYEKISNKRLAEIMGTSCEFASQIRLGKRKLPLEHICAVSKATKIKPKNLRPDIAKYFVKVD